MTSTAISQPRAAVSTSRRSALLGVAGLAGAGVVPAMTGRVPDPDAQLLADCAAFVAAYADRQVLNEEGRQGPKKWPEDRERDYERRADAVDDVFWAAAERIKVTRAFTMAGLLAKIGALGAATLTNVLVRWDATMEEDGELHELIAMSLVQDARMGVVA